MPFFHELIDHDRGIGPRRDLKPHDGGSLCHLLFATREQVDAYLERQVKSRADRLRESYVYREWGLENLSKLWIENYTGRAL